MKACKKKPSATMKRLGISRYDLGEFERRIVDNLKTIEFACDDGHVLYRFVATSGLSFVWDATSRRVRPSRYLTALWKTCNLYPVGR